MTRIRRKKRTCLTLSFEALEELKKMSEQKHLSMSILLELAWDDYYKELLSQ